MANSKLNYAVVAQSMDKTYNAVGFHTLADAEAYCENLRDYGRYAKVVQVTGSWGYTRSSAIRDMRDVELAARQLLAALNMLCPYLHTVPIPEEVKDLVTRALNRADNCNLEPIEKRFVK
jgi:hypothetical protein